MASKNISIIIIEKSGNLKELIIKDYDEEELYKKCGFKKSDGFELQTEWSIKMDGSKYFISVFAKKDGKANTENKYDFPPPIDNVLFFGSCAIVSKIQKEKEKELVSLTVEKWTKFYEKLFGGFEDLKMTVYEDEYEEDELENVPAEKKTKQGYLKDGFVVDSDSDEKDEDYESFDEDEDENEEEEEVEEENNEEDDLEDIGSELSEEEYSDDEEDI
jgi:hypothetical protein